MLPDEKHTMPHGWVHEAQAVFRSGSNYGTRLGTVHPASAGRWIATSQDCSCLGRFRTKGAACSALAQTTTTTTTQGEHP